jgi:hypothetical protein
MVPTRDASLGSELVRTCLGRSTCRGRTHRSSVLKLPSGASGICGYEGSESRYDSFPGTTGGIDHIEVVC